MMHSAAGSVNFALVDARGRRIRTRSQHSVTTKNGPVAAPFWAGSGRVTLCSEFLDLDKERIR